MFRGSTLNENNSSYFQNQESEFDTYFLFKKKVNIWTRLLEALRGATNTISHDNYSNCLKLQDTLKKKD